MNKFGNQFIILVNITGIILC